MRHGFTTGSCAAAAAKAATYMLLFETKKQNIEILTPKGVTYAPEILEITRGQTPDGNPYVSCAVRKDGGDDPDVTTGLLIFARVEVVETVVAEQDENFENSEEAEVVKEKRSKQISIKETAEEFENCKEKKSKQDSIIEKTDKFLENLEEAEAVKEKRSKQISVKEKPRILLDGGIGVGRVTRPGLDQPVGAAAINHVPREMIIKEVTEVCQLADYQGGLKITISVPGGQEVAEKTFNPRLGIVGGISIIGTSGIVEPMSTKAILDTIRVELNQRRAEGFDYVAIAPGNYGRDYLKEAYGYDIDRSVKCSNFIGDTIDLAAELGFRKLLLTGHIGKLVKLAGGIMNTHSREGDCRMELIAAAAMKESVDSQYILQILDCLVTEEAVRILEAAGAKEAVMARLMERIMFYLNKRAGGRVEIECVMYSNEFGELARSEGAEKWFILLAQEQAQSI